MSLYQKLHQKFKDANSPTSNDYDIAWDKCISEVKVTEEELEKYVDKGFYNIFNMRSDPTKLIYKERQYIKAFQLNFGSYTIKFDIVEQGVKTYDKITKKVNIQYLYNLHKKHLQPIGDINPSYDDESLIIKYKWCNPPNLKDCLDTCLE
jgi:hypothetical protein